MPQIVLLLLKNCKNYRALGTLRPPCLWWLGVLPPASGDWGPLD